MINFVFNKITTNYPTWYTAGNTKMEYMAMGLQELGCKTLAINSSGSTTEKDRDSWGVSASGIEYITFCSHKRFKTIRNFFKLYKTLKVRKVKGSNVLIMSTERSYIMLMDILLAKLLGYKTMFLFHEWRSALELHSVFHKIDAWIKDYIVVRLFDKYLPISHYLLDKCGEVAKKKLIVPVLADYSTEPKKYRIKARFCYCCSVWYIMRHTMLIDAMDKLVEKKSNVELLLVLSGKDEDIENFKDSYKKRKCANCITIRTKVPAEELKEIYGSSLGLIIPMNPDSVADIARFSQKIAEYVATGRPIITNKVGEIPYYFKDRVSAYFTEYDSQGFYRVMLEMLENKETTDKIGIQGFMVGKEYFDYKVNAKNLIVFIS